MKVVSSDEMRALDRRTIEEYGTSGLELMERAGQGLAETVQRLADWGGLQEPLVQLIAGRGNNGGDAFVTARLLKEAGFRVSVLLAGSSGQLSGDALRNYTRLREVDVEVMEISTQEDWKLAQDEFFPGELMVDGVLGIGTQGPARGPAAGAIEYINRHRERSLVLAIDVPSGLSADTGVAEGDAVYADVTVTMGLPKIGLLSSTALEYVGDLEVLDIGFPPELVDQLSVSPDVEFIHADDLRPLFPRRKRVSHKGTYGHVLLIGGARGYSGAIVLAAQAAVRAGAGLVSVWTPHSIAQVVAVGVPEAMVHGVDETEIGSIASSMWAERRGAMRPFDAVLVGPGMTRHKETLLLLRQLIRDVQVPLVLDADAISVFEGQPHWMGKASCPLVLTPHPGELSTLFGQSIQEIEADRVGVALAAARFTDATVILKGAGTVVARPEPPVHINMTGNPGMATGGAGDVLSGMIVALLGQGMTPFDAVRSAVYLHGKAGDLAGWRASQAGLSALDLVREIPLAFRFVSLR